MQTSLNLFYFFLFHSNCPVDSIRVAVPFYSMCGGIDKDKFLVVFVQI